MRLDDILDDTIELLIANAESPRFKTFGALAKSKFQNSKSEDCKFLMSDMYKGQIGNREANRKGKEKYKQSPNYAEEIKEAAKKRANWYKNPENKKRFMEKIKKRKRSIKKEKVTVNK